jgi:hypothetical protein
MGLFVCFGADRDAWMRQLQSVSATAFLKDLQSLSERCRLERSQPRLRDRCDGCHYRTGYAPLLPRSCADGRVTRLLAWHRSCPSRSRMGILDLTCHSSGRVQNNAGTPLINQPQQPLAAPNLKFRFCSPIRPGKVSCQPLVTSTRPGQPERPGLLLGRIRGHAGQVRSGGHA